jgi:hypothetical protein
MSPMADYYSALAPSAFVNRALVDYPNGGSSESEPAQGVMATPYGFGEEEGPKGYQDRVSRTTNEIMRYHDVLSNLTGSDNPYWPKAVLIEPESKGTEKKAAGIYSPEREVIELYGNKTPGYIVPDLGSAEPNVFGGKYVDEVLPHELAHFVDQRYRSPNEQVPVLETGDYGLIRAPRAGYYSGVNESVLLNEMPGFYVQGRAKNGRIDPEYPGYMYYPTALAREMSAGNPAKDVKMSELYADQLGKALSLWRHAPQYSATVGEGIQPVTADEVRAYNEVAQQSPYLEMLRKIASEDAISREEVAAAEQMQKSNAAQLAGAGMSPEEGMTRQDQIARAILMEMAVNRLQAGTNQLARRSLDVAPGQVLDPASGQMLPISGINTTREVPSNFRIRVVPKK